MDIDSLSHFTRIYSNDVDISFGIGKCSQMIPMRGMMITTEGAGSPEGNIVNV